MRHLLVSAALASAVFAAGSAAAAEQGFEVGARLGYAVAMGEADADTDLDQSVSGQFPLWLDVGYRVIPALMVGAYFQYGIGIVSDDIDGCGNQNGVDVDCSVRDIRLGAQLQYHFLPWQQTDPWIGAGFGYEWLTLSQSASAAGQSADVSVTGRGFEFLNLQGGVDFTVSEGVALGPFVSFSLAQFDSSSISCDGSACGAFDVDEGSNDIEDKGMHQWLFLGVRGTFVP